MATEQATLDDISRQLAKKPRTPLGDAAREFRKNRLAIVGLVYVVVVVILAIFAPLTAPYTYDVQNTAFARAKPMTPYTITTDRYDLCHWKGWPVLDAGCTVFIAGSDSLGRDVLSRVIYGARVSLAVVVVGSLVSITIGLLYGTLSGYVGGRTDNLMMRIVDFLYASPVLVLLILMQVYFKALAREGATGLGGVLIDINRGMGGLFFLFIALGALNWLAMARLSRGQVLSQKNKEYVEAARSIGSGSSRIMRRHLLPNIVGPLIVAETLALAGYIFAEAFLSFIGLGVDPPTPSWGAMISESYAGLRSNPHLVLIPGLALTFLALSFNFMGDGLRDAIDPRIHGR